MIKKISLILLGYLAVISFNAGANTQISLAEAKSARNTLYFGSFTSLPSVKFCLLYDGEEIELKDGSFVLKDQYLSKVNFLFVDPEKIHFATEDSTVQKMSLKTDDYLFFELKLTQIKNPDHTKSDYVNCWQSNPLLIKDHIIPLNSLIIPISPSKIDIKIADATSKPSGLAVKLPNLTIKSRGHQSLEEIMVEGYLKMMAIKPFHTKQRVQSLQQNSSQICLIL